MKRLSSILLCLLLLLTLLPAVHAEAPEQEGKVVRVGWYESAFHRTDKFGRRSGYGYEYQQRIASLTGWTYEYVEGSWSELYEMLVAGEIDLLSDVSYTEARAEKILYSAEIMGSEDYHIFIAPDNTDISTDSSASLNGKSVGVNKNSIQEQMFLDWCAAHDVHPNVTELTGKTPELLEMLKQGEIDALVTLDTYGRSADVVPVYKVGFANSYFGISRLRPDIKQELDAAMNRILEDNRDFNQQLTERFNKASSIARFLTTEEKAWAEEHGVIRVGFQEDFLPYCSLDPETGALTGALADYLEFAASCEKNAKLSFEPRAYASIEEGFRALQEGEIDCLFPISLSPYDGEELGVLVCDALANVELFVVVPKESQSTLSRDENLTLAVPEANPCYQSFLMDNFPEWQIVAFKDSESGFKMVSDGRADGILVSSYRLNRVHAQMEKYRHSALTLDEEMTLAFAVRKEDVALFSILSKTSRLMPDTAVNSALNSYSYADEHVTFMDFLSDNVAEVLTAAFVIFAVILLLMLRYTRSVVKMNEGQQLISEAEHDNLTRLYNRSFFFAYVNRLNRQHPDRPMDAIVLNIERFHSVNNVYGHEFGDEVLRALGAEIDAFLKETGGIAGRMDGDHFDLYCAHRDEYETLLERFQTKLDEIAHSADIRLRMGVMPWQPGLQPETMFDLARSACSMVRGQYTVPLMVYDDELRRQDQLNQRLRSDLARALEQEEFEVYYQPKYAIQHEKPVLDSAEALVRWRHPELGMIEPGAFIPLFEQSGQISLLDNYVWKKAAQQIISWRDSTGVTLPVSVNLSRVDVFDTNFPSTLDHLTSVNGLDHGVFKLEITESAYTENADTLIRVVRQLREKGYVIEMDDFGSGYSSLNMLSSMPVDVLKMDMKFVQNIETKEKDLRLVKLILDIAKNLSLKVVAEGVETEGQLRLLRDAGCDFVQGFYFCRPLPAEEFEKKLLRQ